MLVVDQCLGDMHGTGDIVLGKAAKCQAVLEVSIETVTLGTIVTGGRLTMMKEK